jgi:hypothetical protein
MKRFMLPIGLLTVLALLIFTTPFLAKEVDIKEQAMEQVEEQINTKVDRPIQDRKMDQSCLTEEEPLENEDETIPTTPEKEELRDRDQKRDCDLVRIKEGATECEKIRTQERNQKREMVQEQSQVNSQAKEGNSNTSQNRRGKD